MGTALSGRVLAGCTLISRGRRTGNCLRGNISLLGGCTKLMLLVLCNGIMRFPLPATPRFGAVLFNGTAGLSIWRTPCAGMAGVVGNCRWTSVAKAAIRRAVGTGVELDKGGNNVPIRFVRSSLSRGIGGGEGDVGAVGGGVFVPSMPRSISGSCLTVTMKGV